MTKLNTTIRIRNVDSDTLDTIIDMLEEDKSTRVKVVEVFDSPAGMEQPK